MAHAQESRYQTVKEDAQSFTSAVCGWTREVERFSVCVDVALRCVGIGVALYYICVFAAPRVWYSLVCLWPTTKQIACTYDVRCPPRLSLIFLVARLLAAGYSNVSHHVATHR